MSEEKNIILSNDSLRNRITVDEDCITIEVLPVKNTIQMLTPEQEQDLIKKSQELLAALYESAKNDRSVSDFEVIVPRNYSLLATENLQVEVIITPLADVNDVYEPYDEENDGY
jgi:hypothetical protein